MRTGHSLACTCTYITVQKIVEGVEWLYPVTYYDAPLGPQIELCSLPTYHVMFTHYGLSANRRIGVDL